MNSNRIIITSVVLYVIILIIMYICYSNLRFTGSDAAGNGMSQGITFIYGLVILFFIAVIFTVVNAFFFKSITTTWVKFIFFVPLLLPTIVFIITFLEIGKPKEASIEKQAHSLTFEIKTKEKLKKSTFSFRTSNGGSHGKLDNEKTQDGFYIYEKRNALLYDNERMFYIKFNGYETPKYNLEIPYKPLIIPFTDWESLYGINNDTKDTIELKFRYKITKNRTN